MMAEPLTIGARNAEAMTGMSWAWVLRFAREHGVPIYRVGARKQLVDARALLAAIATLQAAPPELSDADEQRRMLDALGMEIAS